MSLLKAINNSFVVVLIAFASIAGFILVQFAFIELFVNFGWLNNCPPEAECKHKECQPLVIKDFGRYAMMVGMACVFPAVFEELIFRLGVLLLIKLFFDKVIFADDKYKDKRIWGDVIAVVASSLIFAFYHGGFSQLVYQFILGVVFAMILLRTGNILYAMLAHFINNFFIVTYVFIVGDDMMAYSWDGYAIVTLFVLAILGSVTIIGLLGLLRKENHGRKRQ